eukprot:12799941-Prorocentrum_lima.AAC.1
MTSSLVGSEMCIRDRSMTQSCHPRLPYHESAPSTSFSAVSCRHHSSRDPVSYTHLTLPTICSV